VNKTSETASITCPNNDCGKNFEKPLSTINIQQDPKRKYQACPYCLTEIPIFEREYQQEEEISEEITTIQENDDFEVEEEDKKVKDFSRIEENQSDCKYHLGYLGEEKHQQIPDDCLICAKIMECMRQR
jgi:hypothetical protein